MGPGGAGARPQHPVAEGGPQALADLPPHVARPPPLRRGLRRADAQQAERRAEERERVEQEHDRRGDRLHQERREPRPADLRQRAAGRQPRVRRHETVAPDERGQVGRIGELEEHRARADHEGDGDQELHRQQAGHGQERDGRQQPGAREVGPDHHRAPAAPVDPHARGQAEQEVGGRGGRREQPHLARTRIEVQRGRQRQRDEPDLGAEHGCGLAAPQLQEVAPHGRVSALRGMGELDPTDVHAHPTRSDHMGYRRLTRYPPGPAGMRGKSALAR
ncbi:MAG: hypothetical protein AVDCRST_MAG13-1513 [uncultured Solirubrobacteraceae bacterium]|uniref:Uncharacterized protein n=1 Tax=uncultured Solirubrobacteraceae bacterium TaxID=1162706 RepID=A0A6J4S7Z8_9ACTN|nr:MAG: hypothetical protein AVDCRST_MAG13-1513 [uncultured Solirubrobacteraceae bacterium]